MVIRNWEEPMYWIRVRNRDTGDILYEYSSVFTDVDEAVEDVNRMVEEGKIPYTSGGYTIDIFDTHPDIPGVRPISRRGVRPR